MSEPLRVEDGGFLSHRDLEVQREARPAGPASRSALFEDVDGLSKNRKKRVRQPDLHRQIDPSVSGDDSRDSIDDEMNTGFGPWMQDHLPEPKTYPNGRTWSDQSDGEQVPATSKLER